MIQDLKKPNNQLSTNDFITKYSNSIANNINYTIYSFELCTADLFIWIK